MTGKIEQVEVITSVQRRRHWSAEEKAAIVQETYAPGMSVSLVARRHGIAPNQLFRWRRLYAEGALSAVGAGEEVVPASEYRALQSQVPELQRLLGKKTLENEILREALDLARPKKRLLRGPSPCGTTRREDHRRYARGCPLEPGRPGKHCRSSSPPRASGKARDRAAGRDQKIIAGQPTYGYRRVHALIRRRRQQQGGAAVNVKRVYRS
jgi:transposase